VVAAGLLVMAGALWLLSTVQLSDGYGRVAATLALLGTGMGLTVAPATESIMGSLPLAKAGVGSAMNDTTRQVGGALGVAILGSILASVYSSTMSPAVGALPPEAADAASDSIGGALAVASTIGEAGAALAEAAKAAYIDGMGTAIWVAAGVALAGAVLTWLYLPARPTVGSTGADEVVEASSA
jgi:hypothetical protein